MNSKNPLFAKILSGFVIVSFITPVNFILATEVNSQTQNISSPTGKTLPENSQGIVKEDLEVIAPTFSVGVQNGSDSEENQKPEKDNAGFASDKDKNSARDSITDRKSDNFPLFGEGATKSITTEAQNLKHLPKTDPSTGALVYGYEFALPPGRNNLTSSLSLTYNSNTRVTGSIVGYGWSFDIPYIERLNKRGSEKLYDNNDFSSSLSGELVSIAGSGENFISKVDNGEFLSYSLANNTWTVYDKSGTRYLFGNSASARQDDSASSTKIYRWMLEEVRDTNDNYVKYEYFKDKGQIYPSKIIYTGHSAANGIFEIVFNKETYFIGQQGYYPDFLVQTDYRITGVEIKENGEWVRKYNFTYTGNGARNLLASIVETGRDLDSGGTAVKPVITFSYKESETVAWNETSGSQWEIPLYFHDEIWSVPSRLIQVQDVNGDGYSDIIHSNDNSDDCVSDFIYMNNADGTFTKICNGLGDIPLDIFDGNYLYPDNGVRVFDYNGDFLPDISRATTENWGDSVQSTTAFRNTGTGWSSGGASSPVGFIYNNSQHRDNGVQAVDVNGDGITDIVLGHIKADYGQGGGDFVENVYLGNGTGSFTAASAEEYTLPWTILDHNYEPGYSYAQFIDVNDDGLTDYLWRYIDGSQICGINNGHNWNISTCVPVETQYWNDINPNMDMGVRAWDVDGDRAVDLVKAVVSSNGSVNAEFYKNYLPGLSGTSLSDFPLAFADDYTHVTMKGGPVVTDINADGINDLVYSIREVEGSEITTDVQTHLGSGTPFVDLLTGINTGTGASSTIKYKLSTQYKDENGNLLNPSLPLAITAVDSIETDDGFGNISSENYLYIDGFYYYNNPQDRKFSGFGRVEKTDADGNVTKTYFHQGNNSNFALGEYDDHISKAGNPYRVESYNDAGNLYSKTINKWDRYDLGDGASFVKLIDTVEFTYDGNASHKDKASRFSYDNNSGNTTSQIEYGEVSGNDDGTFTDTGADKFITSFSYATSTSNAEITKLSQELTTDNSGNKVREKKIYYDNLLFGNLDKGNPTKEEQWKSGSSYIDIERTFNSYGLVTEEKDPRDKVTSYAYDQYNLQPETITNPLGHITKQYYDYSSGQVRKLIDQNNNIYETFFDPFDRVREEKQPKLSPVTFPGGGVVETKAVFEYTDDVFPRMVKKTDYLTDILTVDSYIYFDGLNRKIEERVEAEDTDTYKIKDYYYNSRGLLASESLPFFGVGATYARESVPPANHLLISYTYDSLGRVKTITNNLGTTNNDYDDWKVTTTDAENKVKEYLKDAYGNLIQVVEQEGVNQHITAYEWNGNKNLTKITDALGNVRNFSYDGLSRRLNAEDLHNQSDGSYGTWVYNYDDSGNLISQTDPKNQTISFTYDDLNRPLTEDYTGQTGIEISYSYDSCSNGKGQLCVAASESSNQELTYNPLGLMASETRTIDSNAYTTNFTYDRQGNITNIKHPDNFEVAYTFNTAGLLETIRQKEFGGSFVDVVTDFDYSPHDLTIFKNFGSFVESFYEYDPENLYRLSKIITTASTTQMGLEADDNDDRLSINENQNKIEEVPLLERFSETRLLGHMELKDGTVKYAYRTNQKIDDLPVSRQVLEKSASENLQIKSEDRERRSTNSRTFYTDKPDVFVTEFISGDPQYYKDENNKWWLADYGVISKEFFEEQTSKKVSFFLSELLNKISAKTVYAAESTFFPNSSAVDGFIQRTDPTTWDEVHDMTWGNESDASENIHVLVNLDPNGYGGDTYYIARAAVLFDTSAIGQGTIQSASVSLRGWAKTNNDNDGDDFVSIVSSTPLNNTSLNSDDYDQVGDSIDNPTEMHDISERKDITSINTNGYEIWTLNATGLGNINTNGISKFGVREGHDILDHAPVSNGKNEWHFYSSERPGTGEDPKLVVVHTVPPSPPIDLLTEDQINPLLIVDSTPEFSAVYYDDDPQDTAMAYQIQVDLSSDFTEPYWDSGKTNLTNPVTVGLRTEDISYSGNALAEEITYYWRIRFWDSEDLIGSWSTETAHFSLDNSADSNLIQHLSYGYSPVGNIVSIDDISNTDTRKSIEFDYDDLHRLISAQTISATSSPFSETYTYSPIGNIINKSDQGNYIYSEINYTNPHAATLIGGVGLVYDNNGNLISYGGDSFAWDYRNRMTSTTKDGNTVNYYYDHTTDRVKMVIDGETSLFPNQYWDTTSTGSGQATTTRHIYDNKGGLIATVEEDGSATSTYYIHPDHLGGTNVVTDESGDIMEVVDYLPFGKQRIAETAGSFTEKRKFTGHQYDEEADLNYMNARYQDGEIGRFLSQDPVFVMVGNSGQLKDKTGLELEQYLSDPQLHNSYSYVRNNPVKYQDPTGEILLDIVDVGLFVASLNAFNQDPSLTNGIALGVDTIGLSPVIPAIGGLIRHGDDLLKGAKAAVSGVDKTTDISKISGKYNWGNSNKLIKHTEDHAADFGLAKDDYAGYANKADAWIESARNNPKVDNFVDSRGYTNYFDPKTKITASTNNQGGNATFFRAIDNYNNNGMSAQQYFQWKKKQFGVK